MITFRIRRPNSARDGCDQTMWYVETLFASRESASLPFSPHDRLLPLRLMAVHFEVFGYEHRPPAAFAMPRYI